MLEIPPPPYSPSQSPSLPSAGSTSLPYKRFLCTRADHNERASLWKPLCCGCASSLCWQLPNFSWIFVGFSPGSSIPQMAERLWEASLICCLMYPPETQIYCYPESCLSPSREEVPQQNNNNNFMVKLPSFTVPPFLVLTLAHQLDPGKSLPFTVSTLTQSHRGKESSRVLKVFPVVAK
jgi:hypothetical protein